MNTKTERPKMLILANRSFHNGPRMIREIKAFKNDFDITTIGLSKALDEEITFVNIRDKMSFFYRVLNFAARSLFFKKIWHVIFELNPIIFRYILKNKYDVVIIHEPNFLPIISKLKRKYKFVSVYNAHEYHPLEFEDKPNWTQKYGRYQFELYKRYLKDIDLMINVCNGIAEKCLSTFQKDSIVIPNVAIQSLLPTTYTSGFPIKIIYHGNIMKSRRIELMIEMMKYLGDQYILDIMGMVSENDAKYFQDLQESSKSMKNVHFIPPVKFNEIVPFLNKYDIGLFLLYPTNFNYEHALPNKLYEFIQAKLCIAIGPSVEMKYVVDKYNLGVVSDTFEPSNLAEKIKSLNIDQINMYKNNAELASVIEQADYYGSKYLQAIKNKMN